MSSPVPTRAVVGALLIGAIVTAGILVSPAEAMGVVESLSADPYRFALVVVGLYLVRPLLAWPTTPLAVVVGYGYGIAIGIPVALVGVVTTVIPVFVAARWFTGGSPESSSPTASRWRIGRLLERTETAVARYYGTAGPIRGVTASRLAPIPSDVATCAAAVSGVRLRHLVIGTALGELPWTVAAVVVGASAATVTTDGLGELGVALAVACGVAAALLLAVPTYRTLRTRTWADDSGRSADS